MDISQALAAVRPHPACDDKTLFPYGTGLREMHLRSVAAALASAGRIAAESDRMFGVLGETAKSLAGTEHACGPVPAGVMETVRYLGSEATVVLGLLESRGDGWGIERPAAMNRSAGWPTDMLLAMADDAGRSPEEAEVLRSAARAVSLALGMAAPMVAVFARLSADGMGMAGHFLDTDDNDGEYLRRAAEAWRRSFG